MDYRLPRRVILHLGVMALVGVCTACGGPAGVDSTLPDGPHPIIIINIDSLRADHLGCYGYQRDTSPNIDALAREATRFEWAFAQAPTTPSSQASILTGLYPSTHGVIEDGTRLPQEAETLAEALSAHGYSTAAFVDGGFMSAEFGFDQGFNVYDNSRGGGIAEVGPKALSWLREHASENFLLLVHTYDVHVPYAPPEPYSEMFLAGLAPPSDGFEPTPEQMEAVRTSLSGDTPEPLPAADLEYAKALYDGEIRLVDAWVSALMDEVRSLGLDDRATIVLLSDHGEEFQEHGSLLHDVLYTTVTRIPLLVRLPTGQNAGEIAKPVESVAVMPTLLELAGAPTPPAVQGASLVPLMLGQGTPPYRAFSESPHFGGRRAVTLAEWRMLLSTESDAAELYNLHQDPLELNDLAVEEPNRVAVLRRHLDEWHQRVASASLDAAAEEPLDDSTLEQLKSLGYVQ